MDKRKFYYHYHKELAKKYNTTEHIINCVRSFSIGYKKSQKEVAEWAAVKFHQPARYKGDSRVGRRSSPKKIYQDILNFVASSSKSQWTDITQKTKFDK